jgi:hypothetical protein
LTPTARPALGFSEALAYTAGALVFNIVAILNCGGYRYGAGDQAFYVPAVVQHLDPTLFPRDRSILHVQDRLMFYDDAFAFISRAIGARVPVLFFSGYLAGIVLLFGAAVAIGRTLYRSWWSVAALAALLTLRHRITQTGANSLEAYFQPRMLAFAVGAWAIAAYLRGKGTGALVLLVVAFALHPTTAVWFAVLIVTALAFSEARWRVPAALVAAGCAAVAVWAIAAGPLQGHLTRIDPLWASALEGKDYIFPSDWNASFWIVNFSYLIVAALILRIRMRRGVAQRAEIGLVAGGAALVLVFLVSWPLMAMRVALAVQLQTSRVFWMLDFLAAVYIAWLFAEGPRTAAARKVAVGALVAVAIARGVFVWHVEHAGTPLVQIDLPQNTWTTAMHWIAQTPSDTHVLVDPGHAWKYGTSVRVAAQRDVYLEEVKDLALALYSRNVAVQALARIKDAANLETMSPDELRELGARYDLDYFVAERTVDLPVAYRNERFRIYSLK